MEKHIYTHAHKSKHSHTEREREMHTRPSSNTMCAVRCELVCGFAISFKNENHLADGKAQNTLTHELCELVRV